MILAGMIKRRVISRLYAYHWVGYYRLYFDKVNGDGRAEDLGTGMSTIRSTSG